MTRAAALIATLATTLATFSLVLSAPADARPRAKVSGATTVYDGAWHMSFVTRAGACDPSYEFDVNIAGGVISHPSLVRFHGRVARGGAARASVVVQDKSAAGSGRLSQTSGQGSWSGYSAGARCSGAWIARKI